MTSVSAESILSGSIEDECSNKNRLKLKGQMVWMLEWEAVMFIGTPMLVYLHSIFIDTRDAYL